MTPELRAAVLAHSREEKLDLIGELWDELSLDEDVTPVPDWQIEEIERRAEFEKNPGSGLTIDEVVRNIRAKHGR